MANHKKTDDSIYKNYINLRNDITENGADIDLVLPVTFDTIAADSKRHIDMASCNGAEKAYTDISQYNCETKIVLGTHSLNSFYSEVEADTKAIFKDLKARIKECDHDNVKHEHSTKTVVDFSSSLSFTQINPIPPVLNHKITLGKLS